MGRGGAGSTYSYWALRGLAVVVVLAVLFGRFLLRLPAKTRNTFLISAFLYIGGAVGFDIVGIFHSELHSDNNLTYSMIATVEESLEMAGVIVFIYALLTYIAQTYGEVRFRLDDSEENSRSSSPRF